MSKPCLKHGYHLKWNVRTNMFFSNFRNKVNKQMDTQQNTKRATGIANWREMKTLFPLL